MLTRVENNCQSINQSLMNRLPFSLDGNLGQADTQPDLASQLQRALRRAISDQGFTPPIAPPSPAGGNSAYLRTMPGGQPRDLGALESGRSRRYSINAKMPSLKGDAGAKVVPVEGGGGGKW